MTAKYNNPSLSDGERERLILDHRPLLQHIVGRLALDLPAHVDREDLLGFGMLGLIASADAWEPARGLQFSTYAYNRIRGAILDELRRMDFLPRGRRDRVREFERACSRLEQAQGVPPTLEQLAGELGWSSQEVDECLSSARSAALVSLDDGPSEELSSLISDPSSDDPLNSAEREELKALLVEAIASLPEQEKTVITLYYGEGLLLKDIGAILSVSESRVSQIHGRAIFKLNRELVSTKPKS